jgi:hypothetical protein
VGGVLALLVVTALAICCLRRRRRQQQDSPTSPGVQRTQQDQDHAISPGGHEKFATTTSTVPYANSGLSPSQHSQSFNYSPHTSPPPPSWSERQPSSTYYGDSPPGPQHAWSDWQHQRERGMSIEYAGQQQYYPPPQEPLQSSSKYSHVANIELPGQNNQVSEMPEVKSPAPRRTV